MTSVSASPRSAGYSSDPAISAVQGLVMPQMSETSRNTLSIFLGSGNVITKFNGATPFQASPQQSEGIIGEIRLEDPKNSAVHLLEVFIPLENLDRSRSLLYTLKDDSASLCKVTSFSLIPGAFPRRVSEAIPASENMEEFAQAEILPMMRAVFAAGLVCAASQSDTIFPEGLVPSLKNWTPGGGFGAAIGNMGVQGPLELKE